MNKVLLMGRLTKDPEVRYTQSAEPLAIVRYTLAINRQYKRQGEPEADFINCVAFGKRGEFASKYFSKGQMVSVVGRLQVSSWDDATGKRNWKTEVVLEEQHFAESKASFDNSQRRSNIPLNPSTPYPSNQPTPMSAPFQPQVESQAPQQEADANGFYPIADSIEDDDDLPFF